MKLKDIKAMLKPKKKQVFKSSEFLSTGSTLLNLACTGRPRSGFIKGRYFYLVGDSSSGKTWLSLTCFAEACINKHFDDYRLIFDNAEDGALMDFERFFGKRCAERVEPPEVASDGTAVHSTTVEEFYNHLSDAKSRGTPCIYVLDSMDAISSRDEIEKAVEQKKAARTGKTVTGDYGLSRAKKNSSGLRQILHWLRESGSILIIISQTRDRIGFGAMFDPRTRSGGRALTFYATLEMWSSQAGHIKTKIKGKVRELGINALIKVKKNRITGSNRTIQVPLYHSYGIDDVGSCVDYLLDESRWKKVGTNIKADEFDFTGSKEELIAKIQEEELERELQNLVGEVWREIEDACAIKRKKRYE